jgi:protoporphyrinogen oxidase
MKRKKIVILGAGPAGLGAAWQLAKQAKADVTVLEQKEMVGGNAGSFELAGLQVDYGSHRLHPATDPKIMNDLRELMGEDLLDRPRHGRIRLQNRWIHFPLKPEDLVLRLPFSFGMGVAFDAMKKLVPRRNGNSRETFTGVLEKGLGATICNDFYFPYAKKIWGLPPEVLSATQAHKRVSAGSLGKMVKKVLSIVPGFKAPGAGRFFYPRNGFGAISNAIASEAKKLGADIRLESTVLEIELGETQKIIYKNAKNGGSLETIEADYIWSTLPLTILARATKPAVPQKTLEASLQISYRAMVLIYLVLDEPQWTPFDAHYFPEAEIKLTRLSEPKNYSLSSEPKNKTVLCGELPCKVNDKVWNSTDEELKEIVCKALERCGLPITSNILEVKIQKLPFAYPIYKEGYEKYFELQDEWASNLDNVLTFGRQGLFAHDNTHHALAMAYGAVDCLSESGEFDKKRWQEYRKDFEKHVVED